MYTITEQGAGVRCQSGTSRHYCPKTGLYHQRTAITTMRAGIATEALLPTAAAQSAATRSFVPCSMYSAAVCGLYRPKRTLQMLVAHSSSEAAGEVSQNPVLSEVVIASTSVPPPLPPSSAPKKAGFFGSLFRSLQDYGVGRRALAEGSTGLFVAVGAGFCVALVMWARGQALKKGTPYQAVVELPFACGVTIGTPLRIRGVQVGTVLNVRSSLSKVDVLVEVNDESTIIPKNSLIEANQSGLIAEPLLDVTPQMPHIVATTVATFKAEMGKQVSRMAGRPGVSLDDLVYIMTRMARQADSEGLDKVFTAAEAATAAIKEAEPLLQQAAKLVEQVTPLLRELREGGLMGNLEQMTQAAADAAADIQRLQTAVLTDENVKALRQTVLTLCKTLEHVESISSDVSVFSRDTGVQRNLKVLAQALSRLVDE